MLCAIVQKTKTVFYTSICIGEKYSRLKRSKTDSHIVYLIIIYIYIIYYVYVCLVYYMLSLLFQFTRGPFLVHTFHYNQCLYLYIYIYIYLYMYVCVCVCMCIYAT